MPKRVIFVLFGAASVIFTTVAMALSLHLAEVAHSRVGASSNGAPVLSSLILPFVYSQGWLMVYLMPPIGLFLMVLLLRAASDREVLMVVVLASFDLVVATLLMVTLGASIFVGGGGVAAR